jgi:hypothetical protein
VIRDSKLPVTGRLPSPFQAQPSDLAEAAIACKLSSKKTGTFGSLTKTKKRNGFIVVIGLGVRLREPGGLFVQTDRIAHAIS